MSRHLARWAAIALTTACCALATGCGASQKSVARGSEKIGRCTILATNDSEANFDGDKIKGGPGIQYLGPLARVAAEKQRVSKRRKGVLLVSAGDVLQGRYMQRTDDDRSRAARESWQMYERAGYDLAVLGNHEFDAGPKVVAHAIGGLKKLRLVVSNLSEGQGTSLHNPGEKLWADTVIRECGGLKIGFFGLLTPHTRTISDFGDTKFAHPSDPIYPSARRAVAKLRKAGVDAVVALTHLGIGAEIRLAKKVDGIDVVIGGHSHTLLRHEKRVGDTLVAQAGARFTHLGHVELHGKKGGGIDRDRMSWYVRKIDEQMAPDPTVKAAVDELRKAYPPEVVIGQRLQSWHLRGAGRHVYGGLVAKAVFQWLKDRKIPVHATMLNAGGLRTAKTYPKGPVTNLEVEAIHPFRNRIVVAELDGKTMRHLAEHACTKSHRGGGLRVMLHGLKLQCDSNKPAIRYKRSKGKQVGISAPGHRAKTVLLDDKPITDDGTYYIATNNYMARGGSGYYPFTLAKRRCTDGSDFTTNACKSSPTLADIVKDAVKRGTFEAAAAPHK